MQTYHQRQQTPEQGATPKFTDGERQSICDGLIAAQSSLQTAYEAAAKANLGSTHCELNGAIADALHACSEALGHVNDQPDE